jgi:hypothetical protein
MRRVLRFFFQRQAPPPPPVWTLSAAQKRELLELLSRIGLQIVAESRGPVPLLTFGRRVLERLEAHELPARVPLPHFADALKRVIAEMRHDRLRVMSPTDFLGVGYVFNAQDPETWPVQTSR